MVHSKFSRAPSLVFAPIFAPIREIACARARRVVDAAAAVAFRQLSITANTVAAFMQHPDPTTFGPEAVRPSRRKKKEKNLLVNCTVATCCMFPETHTSFHIFVRIIDCIYVYIEIR